MNPLVRNASRFYSSDAGAVTESSSPNGIGAGTIVVLIIVAAILFDVVRGKTGLWAHPSRWLG